MSSEIAIIAQTISSEMSTLAQRLIVRDEQMMLALIEQQLGRSTLRCKHCGKYEQPLAKFTQRFTKLFKNGVLTKIPKTCDKMTAVNDKANPFNNPVTSAKVAVKRCENAVFTEPSDSAIAELAAWRVKLAEATKSRDSWRASE